jgi:cytochrome d ubiquinol oxidase subunit II
MTALLTILFAGYFVLGGLDYGVALMARDSRDLDRIARFFLGNEVWLVAAVGLLFGAFPVNEGDLLGVYRVPVALALIGVVIVTATFGMRIFSPGHSGALGRSGALDGLAKIGGTLAALGWGATLAAVWQGGSFRVTPLVVVCSLGLLALVGLHGWAFLGRRRMLLAATSVTLAGAVAVVGASVTWQQATSRAVDVIAPVAYALVPLLIILQAATWWMFRGRHLSEPTPAR